MRPRTLVLLASSLLVAAATPAEPRYTTVTYASGGLKIEAYLYRPSGDGPFGAVIYNHGGRPGHERQEVPFVRIASPFVDAGYVVLVPERRGYGTSEGQTWTAAAGGDRGSVMVDRLQDEAGDVLAGAAFLRTVPGVDPARIALVGWSLGGAATLLAASREPHFAGVVDQAGGALSWRGNPDLRRALTSAASHLSCPLLVMDAENDATTEAVKTVAEAARAAGTHVEERIYPAFTPEKNDDHVAPGHLLFSPQGLETWRPDVLAFLRGPLAPAGAPTGRSGG